MKVTLLLVGPILGAMACASPLVVTIDSDAKVFAAFDGSVLVAVSDGKGNFAVTVKGSAIPLYAAVWTRAGVVVARFADPEYEERAAAGFDLSPEGLAVARTVLTETQIEALGLTPQLVP